MIGLLSLERHFHFRSSGSACQQSLPQQRQRLAPTCIRAGKMTFVVVGEQNKFAER